MPPCNERGFGRSAALGRPEDRLELLDVLADVVDEHPLDDRSDGHLAARRMGAAALDLLGRKLPEPPVHELGPVVDPVEQLADGQCPIATYRRDPLLIGLDPAERDGN